MTINLKCFIIVFSLVQFSHSLFSQDKPLKEFAESRQVGKYCFYPSTLRMINLSENEDYNQLANSIEKFLIYRLDSINNSSKEYHEVVKAYRDIGFEEYAMAYGGKQSLIILGREQRTNEMVGIISYDSNYFAFYLSGNIQWQKIPTLVKSIQKNEMLNLFDLNMMNGW